MQQAIPVVSAVPSGFVPLDGGGALYLASGAGITNAYFITSNVRRAALPLDTVFWANLVSGDARPEHPRKRSHVEWVRVASLLTVDGHARSSPQRTHAGPRTHIGRGVA